MRTLLVSLFAVIALWGCGERRHPHVILITVDTLRADHLGCYGYRLDTSPRIDRLAAESVRFADCTPAWPKTWPSMASLMTGVYPKTIRAGDISQGLSDQLLLMGEVFQNAGYRTGAVVSNFNLGRSFGFDQGFDRFVESWQEGWQQLEGDRPFENRPGLVKQFTDARRVTDQGLAWLDTVGSDQPAFLWLHYMDVHGPYVPPEEYQRYFQGEYEPEPIALEKLPTYQRLPEPGADQPSTDLAFYRAQYDRAVRYLDDEIDRLLAELELRGFQRDDTILVLTADHGESFAEHDYYLEHGKLPYQACAHIPLLISHGRHLPAGRVFENTVGLIDLPPTLMELAGIDAPHTYEGRSLVELIRTGDVASAPARVFMESGNASPTQLTVREGSWKLINVRAEGDRAVMTGSPIELYDLRQDPQETRNLFEAHPERASAMFAELKQWYLRPALDVQMEDAKLTPQERDMLRALGYVE